MGYKLHHVGFFQVNKGFWTWRKDLKTLVKKHITLMFLFFVCLKSYPHRDAAFSQGEGNCFCFQRFISFPPTSCSSVFMGFSHSVQMLRYSSTGQKAKSSKLITLVLFLIPLFWLGQKRLLPVYSFLSSTDNFLLHYTVHTILNSQKNKTCFINCWKATLNSSSSCNRAETRNCMSIEIPWPACLESLIVHTINNHAYMAFTCMSPVDEQ